MRAGAARAAGVAIALGLALAACSTRAPGAPVSTTSTIPLIDDQAQRDEITALSTQIRQWRLDARLGVEPDADVVATMSARSMTDVAATCATPTPAAGTCREVCDLGDAICANASAICRIADDLAGDVWAEGKCASAKASCQEAEARCCGCQRPTVGMP